MCDVILGGCNIRDTIVVREQIASGQCLKAALADDVSFAADRCQFFEF
ncbi:hypothetical protein [Stakelama pacifica]|uniref:Uncharacterized protein n=1 Tax=Stakelama pacifica TaxID=517720 RepID=A0A4R6FGB7_9SPHN|nr:hypothetical protein [Stakelama pacifica]TDN80217.1 hypothetical protein EV664_1108 [Stakelama pacifica]